MLENRSDEILKVIQDHSFLSEDQIKELRALTSSYIPIANGFIQNYLETKNLCFREEGSQQMVLACIVAIIYSIERERKSKKGQSLIASTRQIQSESAGAYSHTYSSTIITNVIEQSPLYIFIKGSLMPRPGVISVRSIATCEHSR